MKRRGKLGVAGVSLTAITLLGGCGEVVVSQGTTASHGIEDCGSTTATASSNNIVSPSDYSGMVETAKKEASLLHARAQQNDGYIDLAGNRPNGNALKSTPNNLDISWDYDSSIKINEDNIKGYAVDVRFEQNRPDINLGVLACNEGSKVYQTVFYQQLGDYVVQSASFPTN